MAELADAADLKSAGVILVGSSPTPGTSQSCLHFIKLGRWESIQTGEQYTRSVRFDDSLKLYSVIVDQ